ncbi:DUF296 domain-containing protein [Candidatus Micrarchaeota archaeon]|nr:DUF296 domain-containing protein [Candidatus Micrarchaeota archaeon]
MISKSEGRRIMIRFEDGDEFFQKLGEAVAEHEISSGIILCSIGMMRQVTLEFYMGREKGYLRNQIGGPLEVVSLQGNIGLKAGKPIFHVHACLADSAGKVVGGHLKQATVHFTNEMLVMRFDEIKLLRKFEESSGLNGLFFS